MNVMIVWALMEIMDDESLSFIKRSNYGECIEMMILLKQININRRFVVIQVHTV